MLTFAIFTIVVFFGLFLWRTADDTRTGMAEYCRVECKSYRMNQDEGCRAGC